jgi:translation initiation factor 2 alpha subunit (eIF-2alpha)
LLTYQYERLKYSPDLVDSRKEKKKIKFMTESKTRICLDVSEDVYKEFNMQILEKYGKIYGHLGKTVEEGMRLWIKNQQKKRSKLCSQKQK